MKPKSIRLYSRAALLLMILLTTVTAWAETKTVNYIDADGTQKSVTATILTGNETPNSSGSINLAAGWYVVNSDIEYTNTFYLKGEAHLILADGKTMSMSISNTTHDAIHGSYSFVIYGQTAGTGKLIINNSGNGCDGIRLNMGTVTINGGIVEVQGNGCGIYAQDGITINGSIISGIITCNTINNIFFSYSINMFFNICFK